MFNGERRNDHHTKLAGKARRDRGRCETGGGGEVTTPLDALVAAVQCAASYNAAAEAAPETVLWCDANQEFLPLLPKLRERLPELLTYGDFDAATRTGPAVWLRAALARARFRDQHSRGRHAHPLSALCRARNAEKHRRLPGASAAAGLVHGGRHPVRARQREGLDAAGLSRVRPRPPETWHRRGHCYARRSRARRHAFLQPPCGRPERKAWDADQLNALLGSDLAADMLDWIDGAFTEVGDPSRFAAFANIAEKQLKLDPRKLSPQDAVRRLVKREGGWAEVWTRLAASTGLETVVTYLFLEEPGTLFEHSENRDSYPRLNAQDEKKLRQALLSLADLSPEAAKKRIAELNEEHAWRRETIWARRGEAPLAKALTFIAKVAAAEPLPSHNGNALAEAYVTAGADADWAAMCALAAAPRELDRELLLRHCAPSICRGWKRARYRSKNSSGLAR